MAYFSRHMFYSGYALDGSERNECLLATFGHRSSIIFGFGVSFDGVGGSGHSGQIEKYKSRHHRPRACS